MRGIPPDTDEAKLTEFLESIVEPGSIENMRLEKEKPDPSKPNQDQFKAKFAFVCFKTPDIANQVKQHITSNPQQMLGGSRLFATNYEPKEMRMIHQAEARDKADYINATSKMSGNIGQVDQIF